MTSACVVKLDLGISPDDFRGAMRHLVGGVSVITAGCGQDITGMTVTSVSSLSVDPPTLIVSISRASSTWPVLKRYGFFGVNILTSDQLDIAERFSGKDGLKGRERFAGGEWVARFQRAAARGSVGGDRLRGRGGDRASLPCHCDRARARSDALEARGRARLLAWKICRDRSRRRHCAACRGEYSRRRALENLSSCRRRLVGMAWQELAFIYLKLKDSDAKPRA